MIGDGKAGLQPIKQNNFDVSLVGITYMIKVTLSMAIGSYGWRNVSWSLSCSMLLFRITNPKPFSYYSVVLW